MGYWFMDKDFTEARTPRPRQSNAWDNFFMAVAKEVSNLSKCASRQIGAVLVRDNNILSIGFNGSPAGSSLCQSASYCPRRKLGLPSGQGLELCPAQHAEENVIAMAARQGVATNGGTMYMWCGMPCQKCAGAIINAGVKEIVYLADQPEYDPMARILFTEAKTILREWKE